MERAGQTRKKVNEMKLMKCEKSQIYPEDPESAKPELRARNRIHINPPICPLNYRDYYIYVISLLRYKIKQIKL